MNRFFILILSVALMASCRSTKKISTAIAKKDTSEQHMVFVDDKAHADSVAFMKNTLNQLQANKIDYTTFNAKVNVDYRDATGKNYDVNATVRMYKDSAVWVSVNAILGIEALRVLITRDSVKLLDKQNKIYTARSVDYLQEVTALPLGLKTVQDLLVGNPVFLDSNVVAYARGSNTISLLSIGNLFKNFLTLNESDNSIIRSKLDDVDIRYNRSADLNYSDYDNKKGFLFATKRRLNFIEKKNLDIRLDFKQYDFNTEVSFPFSVPRGYSSN
ncbi:MAG: DUF4292 domain-containing protein [Chitinophagaceae bacterium]